MDLATSLPENGNLALLNPKSTEESSLVKSSSMIIEKTDNGKKDEDEDDDDEEDVPIQAFGKIKSSLEKVNKIDTPETGSDEDMESSIKDENEIKMEQEYEKVLRSYLPFHLQTYLENLEEENAETMKTTNAETFCVIAAINIAGKNFKNFTLLFN